MSVKKHNIIRDYLVYSISSFTYLKKAGKIGNYFNEMSHFKRWYKFRNSNEGTLYFQIPWLVFESIDFLKTWVTNSMQVFEYGSGGSTLFFANRAKFVYSVEHDTEWYLITHKALRDAGLGNVDYKLIEPQPYMNYKPDNYLKLEECISSRSEFSGKNFRAYVHALDKFDDDFFDLVVVDGRARQSCISLATKKIKKGGILLLDNAEREFYLSANSDMTDKKLWERKDFVGHFPFAPASILNVTSVFRKLY